MDSKKPFREYLNTARQNPPQELPKMPEGPEEAYELAWKRVGAPSTPEAYLSHHAVYCPAAAALQDKLRAKRNYERFMKYNGEVLKLMDKPAAVQELAAEQDVSPMKFARDVKKMAEAMKTGKIPR